LVPPSRWPRGGRAWRAILLTESLRVIGSPEIIYSVVLDDLNRPFV
jgi:hypothetical protein